MNTPVSLEIEKLLIEKDIDMPVSPTIAEVVMWLYEKHELWIEVSCHTILDEKDDDVDVFYFIVRELKPVNVLYSGDFVNSPTEAYLEAIEYTLKNLI